MYTDDWEPVMTASSMEEKIQKFAVLARDRAEQEDKQIEHVVHSMTHESYLLKHTTSDVLRELRELEVLYPDAFYDGEANDHIMGYLEDPPNIEFWYDYVGLALSAGLEWAVLKQVEESAPDAGPSP